MIGTRDLERILALTLASAYVKDEKPVSLMIVSDRPESGKTQLASRFYGNKGIVYLSDVTAYGLWRDFHKQLEAGEVRHILIPEFLAPLSRKSETVNSFIATLQMIIEEGVLEIHTGFLDPIKLASPVTVGAVICLPRNAYKQNRLEWEVSGFMSRFIVASYKYDEGTIDRIFDSIMRREYLNEAQIKLNFPANKVDVTIPPEIAKKARELAYGMTEKARQAGKLYGYRDLKNVIRMIAANVVLGIIQNKRSNSVATNQDYLEIANLSYLLNEDFNYLKPDEEYVTRAKYYKKRPDLIDGGAETAEQKPEEVKDNG